ncbi:YqaI domain containing protein [Parasponia andersonii]|uniref:YqaI domain containing protein n=1 Tax=Parasponia andersonii TaxID=3476 RepID=A0A2P5BWQ2_PARAD|nr:YqaI domain containing protein [Parasponia andersonii]
MEITVSYKCYHTSKADVLHDDTRLVGDALGSHLAWPKMLVIFEDNLILKENITQHLLSLYNGKSTIGTL